MTRIDLDLRCRCGAVHAVIPGASPKIGNHLKCYCRDCQAYLFFCGCEEELDAHGGAEIFQVRATSVKWLKGRENLAAVKLTDGRVVRWYTTCCRTPMGNTPLPKWLDFAALQVFTLGPDEVRDAATGPLIGSFFTAEARGGEAAVGKSRGVRRLFWRVLKSTLGSAFTRPAKRSPYRNPDTGEFFVTPTVLGQAERDALYARVDAAAEPNS